MKKRTNFDFSKHVLIIDKQNGLLVHTLKVPEYDKMHSFTFINTRGLLIVTGDYGSWMFCREFHPSASEIGVSDGYWCEKLEIHSTQRSKEFDAEATAKEIEGLLADTDNDYSENEKDFLAECLCKANDGNELDYTAFAYREAPSGWDYEGTPFCEKTKPQLLYVFDAFEEVCKRLAILEKENAGKSCSTCLFETANGSCKRMMPGCVEKLDMSKGYDCGQNKYTHWTAKI